ncbi:MAG: type II/IV secretion system protein [Desulfobacteraceae bacterium]|nr:type II/IV secretion system protein [Desulfobacteraceae bacterium]
MPAERGGKPATNRVRLDQGGVQEILESASALKELGLVDDAIAEYERLLRAGYPFTKLIPAMVSCVSTKYSPSKIIDRMEEVINKHNFAQRERAQIKFTLGLEMEKRQHKDLAVDLYKAASGTDPGNKEIRDRLRRIAADYSSASKYDYILREKIVTADQLQKALAISKKMRKSVEFVLIDQFKISKESIGKSLSHYYGCPFKSFDPRAPIPVELIGNLKKSFLFHDVWVPLSWGKEGVDILIDDPRDLRKTGVISGLVKTKKIRLSVGIKEDIELYIRHFFERREEESIEEMIEELDLIPDVSFEEEEEIEEEQEETPDEGSGQIVRLVDQIIVTAYRKNASDIHIEPSPITAKTGVRFRLDGVCQEYVQVPNSMARAVVSRIKVMANLDIAERRLPQDGKIKFKRKGVPPFELRLATLPTAGGHEDAVLRILASAGAMKINEMGLTERNLEVLERTISKPYGLILAVGPTGSGKTTTLHSALGHINKPGIKIWTVEDPVEITQAGLRQVEVKPKIGLDFARVMRSFLRADPDVIMIGEMRDRETASIGIEASLTGHLVFSTLHTNSAPETVTRLLDMGLNPINFSDAFLCVLAQRLARRLCVHCRKEYHPSDKEFEELGTEYGRERFEATKIRYTPELRLYRRGGCERCSGTGYKGRMGIHELIEGTPRIKGLIKGRGKTEEIFEQAAQEGTATLKQDGIQKVFLGLTDMGEIRRVCIE